MGNSKYFLEPIESAIGKPALDHTENLPPISGIKVNTIFSGMPNSTAARGLLVKAEKWFLIASSSATLSRNQDLARSELTLVSVVENDLDAIRKSVVSGFSCRSKSIRGRESMLLKK